MDLYLVRHADAAARDAAAWPDDAERPLTAKGERRFRRAARGLGAAAPSVGLVLCSPLRRARQTAAILVKHAGWPAPELCAPLAEDRVGDPLLELLRAHGAVASIALVGHEPGLGELARTLLGGRQRTAILAFKPGGVAHLRVETALQPGTASLLWHLTPKLLRALRP